MTAGAAVVRGNHDDYALWAYNKLHEPHATIQVPFTPDMIHAQHLCSTASSLACLICGPTQVSLLC